MNINLHGAQLELRLILQGCW